MALPIMGIFLRKLYADPQFSSMQEDEFERPENFTMELNCDKVKKSNSRREHSRREKY
jgi:penicillin-binding protein 1A